MLPSPTGIFAARSSRRCSQENGCGEITAAIFRSPASRVSDVLLQARIDQLALQKEQRRLVVEPEVAERVGQDFRHPDKTRLDVTDEEQMDGAEQQPADAYREPYLGDVAHEIGRRGPGGENSEQGRIEVQHQRRQR